MSGQHRRPTPPLRTRFQWVLVALTAWLCAALDHLPGRIGGQWRRYGQWGCLIGLASVSARLDERWDTGYWTPVSATREQVLEMVSAAQRGSDERTGQ